MNIRNIKRKLSDIWKKLIYDKSGTRVSAAKLSICMLVAVLSISIAYSALSQSLNITGLITKVRQKADIRITNLIVSELNNESQSNYLEYNKQSISVGVTLPNADSSVTYKVEVTNIGNVAMGLLEITGLPDVLKYELTDYTLKEKICDSNDVSKCTLGAVKEFYLTIKYNDGVDINTSSGYETDFTYNLNLDFNFQPIYKVTYSGIEGSESYQSEIMAAETLTVNFGSSAPESIIVLMGDSIISDYTYSNGVLTVPDVSGDIVISNTPEVICTAVNSSQAGSIAIGTEYICDVDPTINEEKNGITFYVLSTDDTKVNLIMNQNIDANLYNFASFEEEDETKLSGYNIIPTVLTQVQRLTTSWSNLEAYDEDYTDKEGYYTTKLTGYARLPKYSEIAELCPDAGTYNIHYDDYVGDDIETNPYRAGCKYSWVTSTDYWTMDYAKILYEGAAAWGVNTEYETLDDFDIAANPEKLLGIRPVITIPKTRLEGYDESNGDSTDVYTCDASDASLDLAYDSCIDIEWSYKKNGSIIDTGTTNECFSFTGDHTVSVCNGKGTVNVYVDDTSAETEDGYGTCRVTMIDGDIKKDNSGIYWIDTTSGSGSATLYWKYTNGSNTSTGSVPLWYNSAGETKPVQICSGYNDGYNDFYVTVNTCDSGNSPGTVGACPSGLF